MNSRISKLALVVVILGGLWLLGNMVFSEKTPREISHKTPFLLKCDDCGELFNYDKVKWSAREFSASEWKDEYRSRNDCLKCDGKWTAKIVGEGKAKDYVEPVVKADPVPPKNKRKPVAQKPQLRRMKTINGKEELFLMEPIPEAPVNPRPRK